MLRFAIMFPHYFHSQHACSSPVFTSVPTWFHTMHVWIHVEASVAPVSPGSAAPAGSLWLCYCSRRFMAARKQNRPPRREKVHVDEKPRQLHAVREWDELRRGYSGWIKNTFEAPTLRLMQRKIIQRKPWALVTVLAAWAAPGSRVQKQAASHFPWLAGLSCFSLFTSVGMQRTKRRGLSKFYLLQTLVDPPSGSKERK